MDIFVRGEGVRLTHTENFMIKKLKSAREAGELETEDENAKKKLPFGQNFESYFDLLNHIISLSRTVISYSRSVRAL